MSNDKLARAVERDEQTQQFEGEVVQVVDANELGNYAIPEDVAEATSKHQSLVILARSPHPYYQEMRKHRIPVLSGLIKDIVLPVLLIFLAPITEKIPHLPPYNEAIVDVLLPAGEVSEGDRVTVEASKLDDVHVHEGFAYNIDPHLWSGEVADD